MNITTFKSHLSRLAPLLHTRTPLPVLSCVKLTSEEGFLVMEASNLDQHMKITMPYDGHALGCCVSLKRLMSVPGEGEVSITQHAQGIAIKGSGFSAKLETLSPDEFPAAPAPAGKEFVLEDDFGDALKWVVKATDDAADHLQSSICFNDLGIVGCDKKRLHIVTFPNLGGVMIPGSCVKALADLMDKGATMTWDERTLSVELEDMLYITRQVAGDYMNVKTVIPNNTGNVWDIDATLLAKLIASLPASQSAPWIDVVADGDRIIIKTEDDGNLMDVEMPSNAVGHFRCNQQWLYDMLSGFKGEQKLELHEVSTGKGMFHSLCIRGDDRIALLSGMEVR